MFNKAIVASLGLLLPALSGNIAQAQQAYRAPLSFAGASAVERVNTTANLAAFPQKSQVKAPRLAASDATTLLTMHPTEAEFNECKVVDANADGKTIRYYYTVSEFDGTVYDWPIFYEGNRTVDADDWIFTKAVNFDNAEVLYEMAVDARVGATNVAESFEICIGKSQDPAAMTVLALDQPSFINLDFTTFKSLFVIPEAGTYYVGIHVKSPKSGWRVILRDLAVSKTTATSFVPAAVTDASAVTVPAEGGGYTAKVAFKFPTVALNGKALSSSENVTVSVSTDTETVTVQGKPGTEGSASVKCPLSTSGITLVTSTANGTGGTLRIAAVPEFDIPVDPTVSTSVSDDNMTATMTWQHVTQGQKGGKINSDELEYNVYMFVYADEETGTMAGWLPVQTGIKGTEFKFTANDETQQLYQFMVTARTKAGESEGSRESAGIASLGKLYEMPFIEDFTEGQVNYKGYLVDAPDASYEDALWGFSDVYSLVAEAGHVGAFCCISNTATPIKGRATLPKVNFRGTHDLQLNLTVYIDDATANMGIYLVGSNGLNEKLGQVTSGDANQWVDFSFNVPTSFDNLAWAYIAFDGSLPTPLNHFLVSRISLQSLEANDFAVTSMTMPTVTLGETFTLTANVANNGYETGKAPTVVATVRNGWKPMAKFNLATDATTLAKGEKSVYSAEINLNKVDFVGPQLTMEVAIVESDDVESNNVVRRSFKVNSVKHPVVSDLEGDHNATRDGIVLTWSNPIGNAWVEGFENMMHGDYSSQLGDWQNLDFDRQYVWAVEGVNFPSDVVAKAFQVIDSSQLNASNYGAYNGTNFVVAFSPQDETKAADDWLISPEIDPKGGLTFHMGIISTPFEESLEILVSTTDRELDSFSPVKTVVKDTWGWEEVNVNLPENAKYIAFHYISRDQFGVMIDDIEFTPAGSTYEFVGYNVYRNDVKLTPSPITEARFEDRHESYESNSYNVSVVARNKGVESEYPLSNTVNIAVASVDSPTTTGVSIEALGGQIVVAGLAENAIVNVYGIDGSVVTSAIAKNGRCNIEVANGLYIVSTSGTAAKVAVR